MDVLTPDMLLAAYRNGYFPMALDRDDPELYWFSPEERGVIPLDAFNIPRGLARAMKKHRYTVTTDQCFEAVIRACGERAKGREETWINETIVQLYTELHRLGHAHSVEVWQAAPEAISEPRVASHGEPVAQPPATLLGGLYGVSIGGAFFGESMFSRAPDASKTALVALVEILNGAGYTLLDTQYVNDHLTQFGVLAMPKRTYMRKLEKALSVSPNPSRRFTEAAAHML